MRMRVILPKSQLQALTECLLQKEVLDGEELRQFLADNIVAGVPAGATA
ncbi:MAG TPA: hypothetical protein VLM91_08545 [Candidatus Methylomirabilis sp.]|nr:hypothetical protein [Candidatus Methylomirabilis sp.]